MIDEINYQSNGNFLFPPIWYWCDGLSKEDYDLESYLRYLRHQNRPQEDHDEYNNEIVNNAEKIEKIGIGISFFSVSIV